MIPDRLLGKQLLDVARRGAAEGLGLPNTAAVELVLHAAADFGTRDREASVLIVVSALTCRPRGDTVADLMRAMEAALDRARDRINTPMEAA